MNSSVSRREFLHQVGLAGATLAALPAVVRGDAAREQEGAPALAFAGVAHIHTPGFINQLKARKDVKVKSVWDPDAARARKRADELGAKVVGSADEVWADPDVKGVVICAETVRHRELVLAGAKARKHLFVEKPLGMNAQECREMAKAIEQAGVLFNTGYFNRTLPPHLFIKEQLAQGNLGKITRIRASFCHNAALAGWLDPEWHWMTDPQVAGCGAFGDLGTHMLDILMWLMGDVEAVAAEIKTVVKRYGDCDECGEALIRFKNGVTGTLAAGWVDVANPVTLLVSGTEGHATVFNDHLYFKSNKVKEADGAKPWTQLPPAQPHPLEMWVDAVGGKSGLPLVPVADAATRVSVMEAMYRAATDRKWVTPL